MPLHATCGRKYKSNALKKPPSWSQTASAGQGSQNWADSKQSVHSAGIHSLHQSRTQIVHVPRPQRPTETHRIVTLKDLFTWFNLADIVLRVMKRART